MSGFHNINTGYNGVTTRHILDHIFTNYSIIIDVVIEDNDAKMKKTYNFLFSINTLFRRIEKTVEYDETGESSYDKVQVVRRPYLRILKTGLYLNAYK